MGLAASAQTVAPPSEHRSRKDHWVDNSVSDVSSISKQGMFNGAVDLELILTAGLFVNFW